MRCGPKTEETRFWCILNLQRYLLLFTRVRHCVVAKFSVMVPGSLLMRLVRMVAAVCSIMNYNRMTDVWDVAISCCVFCQSTPWIAHHKPKHYVTVFATALHSILVEQTVMSSLTVVCSILNVATINWINLVIAFTVSGSEISLLSSCCLAFIGFYFLVVFSELVIFLCMYNVHDA